MDLYHRLLLPSQAPNFNAECGIEEHLTSLEGGRNQDSVQGTFRKPMPRAFMCMEQQGWFPRTKPVCESDTTFQDITLSAE